MDNLLDFEEYTLVKALTLKHTSYMRDYEEEVDGEGIMAQAFINGFLKAEENKRLSEIITNISVLKERKKYKRVLYNGNPISLHHVDIIYTMVYFLGYFHFYKDYKWKNFWLPKIKEQIGSKVLLEDLENAVKYIDAYYADLQEITSAENLTMPLPPPNDYVHLVPWLEKEKTAGRDYYKQANNNRTQMCRNLSKILNWEVNENSLRKAQNA